MSIVPNDTTIVLQFGAAMASESKAQSSLRGGCAASDAIMVDAACHDARWLSVPCVQPWREDRANGGSLRLVFQHTVQADFPAH